MRRLLCLLWLLGYTSACIMLLCAMRERAWEPPVVEGPPTYPAELRALTKPASASDKPPYLGEYRVTVYTPHCDDGVWGYQTATGVPSEHLATCAVDPERIALGTVLDVGGLMLTAADTGSAVTGEIIDIFFDGTKEEARAWLAAFGERAGVWLVKEVRE